MNKPLWFRCIWRRCFSYRNHLPLVQKEAGATGRKKNCPWIAAFATPAATAIQEGATHERVYGHKALLVENRSVNGRPDCLKDNRCGPSYPRQSPAEVSSPAPLPSPSVTGRMLLKRCASQLSLHFFATLFVIAMPGRVLRKPAAQYALLLQEHLVDGPHAGEGKASYDGGIRIILASFFGRQMALYPSLS